MRHQIFTLILALMASAGTLFAASTGGSYISVDGVYYIFNSEDSTALVTWKGEYSKYFSDAYKGDIVIPERVLYEGVVYRVTGITKNAFMDNKYLTSMVIPNSVTSIGIYAFENCTALTSVVIGDSVPSLVNRDFYGCTALTTVTIGEGVTSVGSQVFANCSSLSLIICKATTPPECPYSNNNTFFHAARFTLKVPEASIDAYKTAAGWKSASSRILPLGISCISVAIPTDVPDGYYDDMTLELQSINGQSVQSQKILNKREFLFVNQTAGDTYQALLKNSYGQVLGQSEAVELSEEDMTLNIDKLLQKKDVRLKVTLPDGTDVTDQVSVLWTDESGKAIGYASELKAVAEGSKLTCEVTLRDELARQYAAPDAMQLTVSGEGENLLTFSLQPVQIMMLHGLVKNKLTGEPISDVTVALTQQFGGKYGESVTATTDANGCYELEGTNEQGEMSASASGYIPRTVEFDALASDGTLPTIELEEFNGVSVKTWLTYTESAAAEAEGRFTDGYKEYGDVYYQVFNNTQNVAVKDFLTRDDALYFPSDVAIGDNVTITASSHDNNFNPVSGSCVITKSGLGYVTLPIVQKGGLKAQVSSAVSSSVMGVLYDANGRYARSGIYKFAALGFDGLNAGNYTLVSMTTNTVLRRVLLLSTLSEMGLVEGTDYVKNTVQIKNGRIASVSVPKVPALNEEKLHFTDSTTYITAENNIVNVGRFTTVKSKFYFAKQYAERIDKVELVVDFPEGIEFVKNSAIVGSKVCNYRVENGQYICPVTQENNILRFSLQPTEEGEYYVIGSLRFNLDGVETVQPIGTVWIDAKGLTLNTPVYTSTTKMRVSGSASSAYHGSKVDIYKNNILVGSTKVTRDGTWSVDIRVSLAEINRTHAIKARMNIPDIGVTESKVQYVSFDNYTIAHSVMMIHKKLDDKPKGGPQPLVGQNDRYVIFDYFNNMVSPGFYIYSGFMGSISNRGKNQDFTFCANFDDMDKIMDKSVKVAVRTSGGTSYILNAGYDEHYGCFIAKSDFPDPFAIPISAYAYCKNDFTLISKEELTALNKEKEKAVANLDQVSINAAKTKGETELLPGDDETLNLKYTVPGKDPLAFTVKEMNYDEAATYVMENGPLFYRGEEGTIVYTVVDGTDDVEMIMIDVDEHYALRTVVTYAETEGYAPSRIKSVSPKFGLVTGAGKFGSGVLSIMGLSVYLDAPGQISEMNEKRDAFVKAMNNEIDEIDRLMESTCSDGSFAEDRLSGINYNHLVRTRNDLLSKGNDLYDYMNDAQDDYKIDLFRKALWDVGSTVIGGGLGKSVAVGAATKLAPKALSAVTKATGMLIGAEGVSLLGFGTNLLKSGQLGNTSLDQLLSIDFKRHYDEYQGDIDYKSKQIIYNLKKLRKELRNSLDDCVDFDDDGFDEEFDKLPPYSYPQSIKAVIDPSGFIYEAVPSNRVEGATATVFYKDSVLDEDGNTVGEMDVMWDADTYEQVNPQITKADGMYRWDVPQGLWQVRVQKEGYENNTSDWLPVPPPQLEINIPLIRNRLPQVEKAHAYEDAVTVKFDSYMLPDSLTTQYITVTENGTTVAGTIELTDEEAAPDGATYASQIRFVPTKAFTATEVTLNISGQVVNYAGFEMDEPFEAVLPIEREIKDLVADETVNVEYGSTAVLHVKGTPADAAAGKTVFVRTSELITSTSQATVVLNQDGEAEVTIQGGMLGTDYVTFTMEDNELYASTMVKVIKKTEFMVKYPIASVPTDTEVEKGTEVNLICKTEDAVIYYTLDGSNPLTSDTRILYDGTPIVISAETTLTAVAVVEGKGESEVVIYHYIVKEYTAIKNVTGSEIKVTPVRVHDSFEVNGVDGTFSVTIYSVTGKQLMQLGQVTSGQKVKAAALQTGVYLVVVSGEDAYFTQRIIKE